MSRAKKDGNDRPFVVTYEIVPGSFFLVPTAWRNASLEEKLEVQSRAATEFEPKILDLLGIQAKPSVASVGGWAGNVSPSVQMEISAETSSPIMRACMAAIGLLWRQDAVAAIRLRPNGASAATVVSRSDKTAFTIEEIDATYTLLYHADVDKKATIGFSVVNGSMVFINSGELSDEEFRRTIRKLVREQMPGEVRLTQARADFEMMSTDWSQGNGEDYRRAIRDVGRSDLLDWLDGSACREAAALIGESEAKKASGDA